MESVQGTEEAALHHLGYGTGKESLSQLEEDDRVASTSMNVVVKSADLGGKFCRGP